MGHGDESGTVSTRAIDDAVHGAIRESKRSACERCFVRAGLRLSLHGLRRAVFVEGIADEKQTGRFGTPSQAVCAWSASMAMGYFTISPLQAGGLQQLGYQTRTKILFRVRNADMAGFGWMLVDMVRAVDRSRNRPSLVGLLIRFLAVHCVYHTHVQQAHQRPAPSMLQERQPESFARKVPDY